MSEQEKWLARARRLYPKAPDSPPGLVDFQNLRAVVGSILNHLEEQERQSLTPEGWQKLRRMLEETQQAALRATKPSSPDTEVQAAIQRGSVTSFKTWHLVKVDRNGELPITATVTLPASSSIETRGDALNPLLAVGFELKTLTTWESQSQSGQTPSTTPEAPEAGRTAGGSAMFPDPVSTPSEEEITMPVRVRCTGFEHYFLSASDSYCECGAVGVGSDPTPGGE